jgi:propionyl-CoA carboxylase beta chain
VTGVQTCALPICKALKTLETKKLDNPWRKHGNIPL